VSSGSPPQTGRIASLTELGLPCKFVDVRTPPGQFASNVLVALPDYGQAGLNLPHNDSLAHAVPRKETASAPCVAWRCAAALIISLALATSLSVGARAQQTQQQQAPPPKVPPGRGGSTGPVFRPVLPPVTIASSEQLFTTMCALWAAGYYSGSGLEDLPEPWRTVADQMLHQSGPATDQVHQFIEQHKDADRAATLSRFISFSLVVDPPPDFSYIFRREELPPDVFAIEDFNGLLAKFYKEAQVEGSWRLVQPSYQNGTARLQALFTQVVQQSMGYLREILQSSSPRTFTVFVEPLAGVSTNFRAYGDAYSFVTNGQNTSLTELRYAYLHFVLDQLPRRYPVVVAPTRPILQAAALAPRLPRKYRDDLPDYYAECLVRAVALQMDNPTPQARAEVLDADDAEGYVLVRPLVAQLLRFQQETPSITYYFPDLAKDIDFAAELKRVQSLKFAPAGEAAPASPQATEAAEREDMLEDGERLLNSRDGVGAQAVFEKVLQKWPDTPRATYGLAIAAIFQNQKDRAKELFASLTQATPNSDSDPVILAWSHVYLGRIHDGECDRDKAVADYRAALAVPGIPERAREAAQSGVEKPFVPAGQQGCDEGRGNF